MVLVRYSQAVRLDNLSDPDSLAEKIVENLESALDRFKGIIAQLKSEFFIEKFKKYSNDAYGDRCVEAPG
ncbi:MAG: hypothetical protein ICV79_21850 [Flavisolibacter sp.]|nr:hypothetical protein [Flavisolibacter sp.]